MKTRSCILVVSLLLIASYVLFILFNSFVLRTESLNKLRLMVQMLAPPRDLYRYLVREEIDFRKKGLIRRFEYRNKYLGNHEVGILLDNFSDDLYLSPHPYKLKSKVEIKFYIKHKLVLSRVLDEKYQPFNGATGNGFSLMYYKCPVDLPLDDTILCEITIVEPDVYLFNTYGPVNFFIRKMSDA